MVTPFPYRLGDKNRRLTEKPVEYRGWTIYVYEMWCQATYAKQGWWAAASLAVTPGKPVLSGVGDLRKAIDQAIATGQPPAALWSA